MKIRANNKNRGFTLLELIVAVSLGLLISIIAFRFIVSGQKSSVMMSGSGEIQTNAMYGLMKITESIRKAGTGSVNTTDALLSPIQNQNNPASGIVFTQGSGTSNTPVALDTNLLTVGEGSSPKSDPLWTGISNVTVNGDATLGRSDQLTLQYVAMTNGFNCEGQTVTIGDKVIERYFLRLDNLYSTSEDKTKAIALACDAGILNTAGNQYTGFGDSGQIIIPRVDYFKVMLGVKTQPASISDPSITPTLAYYTIDQYKTSLPTQPIIAIKLVSVVRMTDNTSESLITTQPTFNLDDVNTISIKNDSSKPLYQLRKLYSTTALMMTGRGAVVQ